MDAKGQSGVVDFDGQFVTITRTGLARATVGKGDKRISGAFDISHPVEAG